MIRTENDQLLNTYFQMCDAIHAIEGDLKLCLPCASSRSNAGVPGQILSSNVVSFCIQFRHLRDLVQREFCSVLLSPCFRSVAYQLEFRIFFPFTFCSLRHDLERG